MTATTRARRPATLTVPGATLAYDVCEAASAEPPLLLIGSPMGAGGFGTLAGHFADRTVVTYDPRGVERSTKDDPATISTPEQHADDVHRVIGAVGGGPVDLFASSGGAVNALALVAAHPGDVRTLVAHEPPLAAIVPDREAALAVCRAVADAYQAGGFGPGMARFIGVVGHQGPFTAADAEAPAPDPAMFGLPTEDDGDRTDPLLFQNIISSTHYEPDFDALRAAPTRIVIAVGVRIGGQARTPRRGRRGRAPRHVPGPLPERPRRLPRRRVRPGRRPGRVRREASRGPGGLPALARDTLDADPGVDHHGARGQHDDRIEVHLDDLRVGLDHGAHPQQGVLKRSHVSPAGPMRAPSGRRRRRAMRQARPRRGRSAA